MILPINLENANQMFLRIISHRHLKSIVGRSCVPEDSSLSDKLCSFVSKKYKNHFKRKMLLENTRKHSMGNHGVVT